MSSRWKKVWADLLGNPIRSLLTVLTIAVGTFAVGLNANMSRYMAESMERDFLSANPSEATLYAFPMNDERVKMAREVPGVDAVEGRSLLSADLIRRGGDPVTIQLTAVQDPTEMTVNTLQPALHEDRIPPLGDREVLMDSSASSLGYVSGDLIVLETTDGSRRELRVAGYMHSATAFPYGLAPFVTAYVTPDTLVWLGGDRDYNQLAISVAERPTDQDHVTAVAQAVADRIERSGASVDYVRVYQPGHHFAYSITVGMFFVMGVLGWLTVILGAILVVNTMTALMATQTRQIGMMKATGAGSGQLAGMYSVLVLSFGAAALAVAVPLADFVAHRLGDGMAAWLNFFPATYTGYATSVAQQALVALVVPLVAAARPLASAVGMTVREALSDYGLAGPPRNRDKKIDRRQLLLPRPVRLSLRNAFRRRTRLALTLFALVLGGAVFIGIANLRSSFGQLIGLLQGYFMADINVYFERGYRYDRVAPIALSVAGVSSVEGWLEYPGTLDAGPTEAGRQILFVGPPSTSTLIDPVISSGRWLQAGDDNAVVIGNQLVSMFPTLEPGDELQIELDGRETSWLIVGVYSFPGNIDVPLLYTNYEYISRLIRQPGMVQSLRIITSPADPQTQEAAEAQLQSAFKRRGIRVSETQLGTEFVAQQTAQTDLFVAFMLGMALLIAAIGGLGLMGTMSINVLERTREIGVMRAIGASSLDIQGIVIVEGIVISVIGWLVSIAISFPITVVLTTGVGLALVGAPIQPVFGVAGMIAWLIGSAALGAIASALPARRASSLTVKDTLAYE